MSKKRVKWNKIKNLFLPGWTCPNCHGDGKYIKQYTDYFEPGWVETRYVEIFCDCLQGQKLLKAKNVPYQSR